MCAFFPDLLPLCGCPDCRVCVDRELPLPLPLPATRGGSFSTARAARWHQLVSAQRTIAVALEAPLSRRPVLFAEAAQ